MRLITAIAFKGTLRSGRPVPGRAAPTFCRNT